jgi:Flp pilus assembly protein TadG
MRFRTLTQARRGVHAVEAALIYPISFLLIIGMIVCGMGIFRYQETCHWARAAARWAAVHGGQYSQENGKRLTTSADVYDNAIQPNLVSLDPTKMTCSVSWSDSGEMPVYYNSSKGQMSINEVTVTITYNWIPEAYVGGITFRHTSTMSMEY